MTQDLQDIIKMLLPELEKSLKANNIDAGALKNSLEERRIDLAGLPELNSVKDEAFIHLADETAENKDNKISFRNFQKSINHLQNVKVPLPKEKEHIVNKEYLDLQFSGMICEFATTDFSDFGNWVFCNGRTFTISSYPLLYKKIGNKFGGIAGSTVGIPNLQGLVTSCASGNEPIGKTEGSKTNTLTKDELPPYPFFYQGGGVADYVGTSYPRTSAIVVQGGGKPQNNMQPTIYLAKFIYCA
jgi:microcystin-dependent protein